MKKAIFLVEDIKNGEIVTLLESKYQKINDDLKKNHSCLLWLSEIPKLLYSDPDDTIEFLKIEDFIRQGSIPTNKKIFYFISCFHNIDFFNISNFLLLEPEKIDFLVNNKIPIIIDSSMEMCDHDTGSHRILETPIFKNKSMFKGLDTLDYYIVGSSMRHETNTSERGVKTYQSVFPGPFFYYNYKNSNLNIAMAENKEQLLKSVNDRIIKNNTLTWQAYSNKTRLNRGLFLMKAESENLVKGVGRYSRLLPGKKDFLDDCKRMNFNYKKYSFITEQQLDYLDTIKHIDVSKFSVMPNNDFNFLFWITLETFIDLLPNGLTSWSSFLTEKTAMAIASASPFIPLGGENLGFQLKEAGFKEYNKLEFPNHSSIVDEVDYVIDRIKEISSMTLQQKQNLYDSWKDTIAYNYNHYLNFKFKKQYLWTLNNSRRLAIKGDRHQVLV